MNKIFEPIIFNQLSAFFEDIFLKFECGFRKGYSTQYCLLMMLESWQEAIDKNKKGFDYFSHDLLIAKLHAYGLELLSLKRLQDYLSDHWHRKRSSLK